jgi:2-polyprenyl-3-methyl-5-hydroxy-6-metoxy-1,4-benzoquinol methylase
MTRHVYEYEVDLSSDTAPAHVIRMTGCNRRVLEVGAGPGSITKHLIRKNGCDVVAIEIDPAAIEKLKAICPNVYQLDLNDSSWVDKLKSEDKFDVVIAADVLEHIYDPLKTLLGMKSLLRKGGEIILSLPHVGHSAIIACIMSEDFEYRDWGLLDRTHIRFFWP